jgi:hypothetical protein
MPCSIAAPRLSDSGEEDDDIPQGSLLSDDEEYEPPIHELGGSRTRYCAELSQLLTKDPQDLLEEQIFQNRDLTAERFLNDLTEKLGLSDTVDVKRRMFEWITGETISWFLHIGDPPELMWAFAGTDERWTTFAALAQRIVGMTPSEAEVERIISIQRDLVGTHGTRFGQGVFQSRTQLRQG